MNPQRFFNSISEQLKTTTSPGLWDGKTGLSILLFHYAQYTQDNHYQSMAELLLEQIIEELGTKHISSDYHSGYTGISCAMEYLIAEGFVDANADDLLENIDILVHQQVAQLSWGYCSFGSYYDYGRYLCCRIRHHQHQAEQSLVKNQMALIDLMDHLYTHLEVLSNEPSLPTLLLIHTLQAGICTNKTIELLKYTMQGCDVLRMNYRIGFRYNNIVYNFCTTNQYATLLNTITEDKKWIQLI